MDLGTVILALLTAVLIWFWVKRRRPGLFAGAPKPVAPPALRTMPRLGRAGTITEEQIDALQRENFTPSAEWSFEEAALVLDAVIYLRAVCAETIGVREPDVGVQNELLALILSDEDLRNHVRKWGADRRAAGEADAPPELRRNHQFERVAAAARRLAPAAG